MKSRIADFPDWFGPMLVKELRQGLKTRAFVLSFVGLQLVLILVLFYHLLLYARSPRDFDANGLSVIFWMLIGGILLVVTPLRAFNELAAERKANTLELIFMSGLSAWRITVGKWASLLFQALLFLLAVLPYAILRYYFGGVDLTEDLAAMGVVLLFCAILSACALALSGMPLWVRLAVAIILGFYVMGALPALMFGRYFGSSLGIALSFDDIRWWLIVWDVAVICLVALQVGAATVAPLAENHAGRQRFLTLLLWLPIFPMHWLKASDGAVLAQLFLFGSLIAILNWYYLATLPAPLRSYCQPFAGWRAVFGIPFQPGWPSAVVYALLCLGLTVLAVQFGVTRGGEWRSWALVGATMSLAALLCSTLFWLLLPRRPHLPLVASTLFLILCALAVTLLMAGRPSNTHLADFRIFAALPPFGFWAMLDHRNSSSTPILWAGPALIALTGYAVALFVCARSYWWQYFQFCREARRFQPLPEPPKAAAPPVP